MIYVVFVYLCVKLSKSLRTSNPLQNILIERKTRPEVYSSDFSISQSVSQSVSETIIKDDLLISM